MHTTKKWLRIFIILASVVLIVWLILRPLLPKLAKMNSTTENNSEDASVSVTTERGAALPVQAEPARYGELIIRITATGTTEPRQKIMVSPKVNGQIQKLLIREGQRVKAGDLLFQLDSREYQLALADARSALLKAQGEYGIWNYSRKSQSNPLVTNLQKLAQAEEAWQCDQQRYAAGILSDSLFQHAKAEYETACILAGQKKNEVVAASTGLAQAQTALERAQLNLSNCEVRAPFTGVIGNLKINCFENVAPGTECCQLVDLSQVKVAVGVLENEVGFLETGRLAEVTFPAFPDAVFSDRVTTINPLIDPESKTCRVTVTVANPQYKIKAGMFAYVKLDAQIFRNRFLVPKSAVLLRDNRKLVFIVRDGLAKWCYVDTGLENENFVEIVDSKFGLAAGELVITEGHYTLVHDAPVRVVDER